VLFHRIGAGMNARILEKLKQLNPWHFVWISILFSELITLGLSTLLGSLWWGEVSRETLITGAVDALVVPLIVASVVIYFVKHVIELRQINEQLQEANRKLLVIDRMKTDFVSVVSHELRTPITTIKAFAELLVIKPGMPEEQKVRLMGTISAETDRLTRLIADLLDLARIEGGAVQWRREPLFLGEVIRDALTAMAPLFENKKLHIQSSVEPDLPALIGDHDRIMQVLINILSNAVKFTPEQGVIRIAARRESPPERRILVEISDTGRGIPAEEIGRIFEKFQRSGDHLTNSAEGTGLGLAIARQIIEHHGGTIRATSVFGSGSTFSFSLPFGPSSSAD